MKIMFENIPIVDAHLHLWDLQRMQYPWLDEVPAIRKSFLSADYREATKGMSIEKMVFVQAECLPGQFLEEVRFVTEQAQQDNRIQGIVAYAPVEEGKQVCAALDALKQFTLVKGVRRMYDETPALCCSPGFLEGVRLLPQYGFSFDLSVQPHAIPHTIEMIAACPETQFILDHLGKPRIAAGALDEYKRNIAKLAAFPNVAAKLSGLVTAADHQHWQPKDLAPYIRYAVDCFGEDRLLFGSDWPVVLLAGTCRQWLDALQDGLKYYSTAALEKIFHVNAMKIYRL